MTLFRVVFGALAGLEAALGSLTVTGSAIVADGILAADWIPRLVHVSRLILTEHEGKATAWVCALPRRFDPTAVPRTSS
jgi:hypothetical protein